MSDEEFNQLVSDIAYVIYPYLYEYPIEILKIRSSIFRALELLRKLDKNQGLSATNLVV